MNGLLAFQHVQRLLDDPCSSNKKGLLKYEDVQRMLGVSRRTVNRLVATRKLRAVRLGHATVRFREVDIHAAVERLTTRSLS